LVQQLKRSNYLLFTIEKLGKGSELVATALLSGRYVLMTADELGRLRAWEEDSWLSAEEAIAAGWSAGRLEELVGHGILLRQGGGEVEERWRRLEETLKEQPWPPFGLIFHTMNRHAENVFGAHAKADDVEAKQRTAHADADRFVARRGLPPPAFYHRPPSAPAIPLPPVDEPSADFFAVLRARRTTRSFCQEGSLPLAKASSLLYWSFGCLATRKLGASFVSLFKASASGGSLHPIEAFVLALRVEGLAPGFYHYGVERHELVPQRLLADEASAREAASLLTQRQLFVADAPLVVFLVARFQRNFWKYRERNNTYAVILQDAGHLSQTFQLTATALGLGAFYTGAIFPQAVAEQLALQEPAEAPIGVLGAGLAPAEDPMQGGIEPYDAFAARL
jgi:putative peptide maturation dehydrogenase